MSRSKKTWFYSAFFVYCTTILFLYWPAIHGELVWDDQSLVYNYNLLDMQHWFYNSFQRSFLEDTYYRPLPLLSLMWNGLTGSSYFALLAHATNVAIFCLNVFLVMLLTINNGRLAALLAGGLYAVNPVMMEATAWISGRCDLLLTFFVLLGLLLDVYLKNRFALKVALVSLCFFCAALSKEMAVVFPLLLLIWKLSINNIHIGNLQQLWRWLKSEKNDIYFTALLITGLCYLLLRYTLLGQLSATIAHHTGYQDTGGALSHTLLVMKTFSWYLLLQVFPHFNLSALYITNIPVRPDWASLTGCLLLIATLYLFYSRAVHFKTKYALAVMMLLFLPISNISRLNVWDNFIHLRFLTLPFSCLVIFFVPILVNALATQGKHIRLFFALCFAGWGLASIANLYITVPLWTKELLLWKWATETTPHSRIAWGNYTSALYKSGDYVGCIQAAGDAKRFHPYDSRVYVNSSLCYNATGNKNLARRQIQTVLQSPELDPDVSSAAMTLAASLNMDQLLEAQLHTPITETFEYKNIVSLLRAAIYADNTNFEARYLLITWYIINRDQLPLDELISGIFAQKDTTKQMHIKNIREYTRNKKLLNAEQQQYLELLLATGNHSNEAGTNQ